MNAKQDIQKRIIITVIIIIIIIMIMIMIILHIYGKEPSFLVLMYS